MIRGRTISLVPLSKKHLERTREWANDPEFAELMDRARPISEAEHERWFASLTERDDTVHLAVEANDGGRHLGNVWLAGIDPRHRKAELRIVIGDREALGRGVGTETIALACDYAFGRLNLHKVHAYVLATNPRARRAFEKAGFAVEGLLRDDRWTAGRWVDVDLLARTA